MSDLRNIECFSIAARAVLSQLLESFPRPSDIRSLDLQNRLVECMDLPKDCAWEQGGGCLVDSTIDYLVTEGVIRTAGKTAPFGTDVKGELCPVFIWRECVLTARGFAALNRPLPEKSPVAPAPTLAKTLVDSGRKAGGIAVTELIRQLMQSF